MPEDTTKETAATSEPPGGRRGRLRLASQEFFFLLQRIDRLDEKLSGEIKAQGVRIDRLDEKINALNEKINNKFNNLTFWAVGILVTIIAGFLGLLFR